MRLFGYLNAVHERGDLFCVISESQNVGVHLETLKRSRDFGY